MAAAITETVQRFTAETLKAASRQSQGCYVVPLRLRRAIKKYIRDQEEQHMKRKVSRLSESFNSIKDVNLQLTASTARELIEDPLKYVGVSKRWKIKSNYGDIGFKYRDDQTIAYVASRMPAVFSACHRVLSEVKRRLPEFSPTKVLDFGAGTGSGFWALREVWPNSLETVNLVEPSQSMQRAGQSLIKDLKNLPHIQSYGSIQTLSQDLNKTGNKNNRKHDLVIASYVLGEIPSFKDRITVVRQLWELTGDVLVLMEPGTPHGSDIISQVRSHILWMEKRKSRKLEKASNEGSKDLMTQKCGAHIVAPCPHDGVCPLDNSGKYCHFVQRLQRTTTQLAYKQSNGIPLRGFEDEKFSYVVFRRGPRPSATWPLDGMRFDTLKEQRAKRTPEDYETDYGDYDSEYDDGIDSEPENTIDDKKMAKYESDINAIDSEPEDIIDDKRMVKYESDINEPCVTSESDEEEQTPDETSRADIGSGWGRIVFSPIRRGKRVEMDVCRATNFEGTEGRFERVIVTKSKNPTLHHQARKSLWGDLWPF